MFSKKKKKQKKKAKKSFLKDNKKPLASIYTRGF